MALLSIPEFRDRLCRICSVTSVSQNPNRMKVHFLMLCLFWINIVAQAQETYTVIKVVGQVISKEHQRALRAEDKLQDKNALQFSSAEDYIIVISPKTGRKTIKGIPDNAPREFIQLLQSFVKPETRSTATRSSSLEYIDKLKNLFTYRSMLILGDGYVEVDTDKLKISSPAGIRVQYRDEKTHIARKISDDKGFFLNQTAVFGNQVPAVLPKISIQYYEDELDDPMFGKGDWLADFVPVYVDNDQLKQEINILLRSIGTSASKTDEQVQEIRKYLESEYGGVILQNMEAWLLAQGIIRK